jgi:hypothetical protein
MLFGLTAARVSGDGIDGEDTIGTMTDGVAVAVVTLSRVVLVFLNIL